MTHQISSPVIFCPGKVNTNSVRYCTQARREMINAMHLHLLIPSNFLLNAYPSSDISSSLHLIDFPYNKINGFIKHLEVKSMNASCLARCMALLESVNSPCIWEQCPRYFSSMHIIVQLVQSAHTALCWQLCWHCQVSWSEGSRSLSAHHCHVSSAAIVHWLSSHQ